ncbi:MAG: YbaK/EbsC family protein [Nitrospirota bacterium]|nr:YbaK/EbsC family protein [Nitrospirota bacterium]
MSVRGRIFELLARQAVSFEEISHPPVSGCDDSRSYRAAAGWPVASGASSKCILFHAKERFYLVVTTAGEDIKARKFKKEFGTKDIRFATPDEVFQHTGCTIGSMPPFGVPEAIPIFVDGRIFEKKHFMFNPADPERSIRIATEAFHNLLAGLPNPTQVFTLTADGTGALTFTPVSPA